MRRIVIIGSGGAGKSTLARTLGDILNLPVVHLDSMYWRPGWVETPKDEWEQTVRELVKGDEWIIDGNFGGTMEIRLAAADTVIYLDLPRDVCLRRAIKRVWTHHGRTRPDVGPGCIERLDFEFLSWIWKFRKMTKPVIEERLARLDASNKNLIRLTSVKAVKAFVGSLKAPSPDQ